MNHKGTEDTEGLFSLFLGFGNEEISRFCGIVKSTYSYFEGRKMNHKGTEDTEGLFSLFLGF